MSDNKVTAEQLVWDINRVAEILDDLTRVVERLRLHLTEVNGVDPLRKLACVFSIRSTENALRSLKSVVEMLRTDVYLLVETSDNKHEKMLRKK